MLGSHLTGRRVVVRRRVDDVDGQSRLSDVTGQLLTFGDGQLQVLRDDGAEVTVALGDVVAGKEIPPKRPSHRAIAALEHACAQAWPATETAALGDWTLRAAGGWSRRANSVLAVGDPDTDLDSAIAAVVDWYRSRDLQPAIALPLPLSKRLRRDLEARGWSGNTHVSVRVAPLSNLRDSGPDRPEVEVTNWPQPTWLADMETLKGPLPPQAAQILGEGPRRAFAAVRSGDEPLAIGRGALAHDSVVLSTIQVAPHARRRGLARQIMAALAEWAGVHGAAKACVQVSQANTAALKLYDELGFAQHHQYVYMRPGSD